MKNNKKGFTLIELLVVIAIIGLLSTLAVVALNNARLKARDARRVADVKQMQTALELYFNDQGHYPVSAGVAWPLGKGTAHTCLDNSNGGFTTAALCAGTIYMQQVPSYPNPRSDTPCVTATAGYDYDTFLGLTTPSTYSIGYCLGGDTGGIDAGNNIACESGISGCP